jgi:hypothetical protein
MERNRATRNRDVALTMLIDLLVQVIFVFTLILISANAIEGDPQERGWVTPEAWKTLISIFDIDPRNVRGAEAQLGVIKGKDEKLNTELVACDAKTGACDKQAGRGPGNSPCRNSAGVEMVVAEATIDQRGRITVALGRHARDLPDRQAVSARAIGVPLSFEEFVPIMARAGPGASSAVRVQVRCEVRPTCAGRELRTRSAGHRELFHAVGAPTAVLRSGQWLERCARISPSSLRGF